MNYLCVVINKLNIYILINLQYNILSSFRKHFRNEVSGVPVKYFREYDGGEGKRVIKYLTFKSLKIQMQNKYGIMLKITFLIEIGKNFPTSHLEYGVLVLSFRRHVDFITLLSLHIII